MADDVSKLPVQTRVKACDQCRRQKMRCDALEKAPGPCSRCQRMRRDCLMTPTRMPKRKTKLELQAEINALKNQLDSPSAAGNHQPSFSSPSSAEVTSSANASSASQVSPPSALQGLLLGINEYSVRDEPMRLSPTSNPREIAPGLEHTVSRIMNELAVSDTEVNECFAQFYDHYAPQVPILEDFRTPNRCYNQSPLLFWTIVIIGARRYPKNPTLMSSLAPEVMTLAKDSVFSREGAAFTIVSIILLASWPIPFETMWRDESPMLLGAAFQLAMSIGLHVFGVGQDFSRIKLSQDRAEMEFRARVWTLLVITYQRSSFTDGTPPVTTSDMFNHYYYSEHADTALLSPLQFQKKLTTIQAEAILDIEKVALSRHPRRRAELMNPIIDGTCGKLSNLESECTDQIQCFHVLWAELQILSFHLFVPRAELSQIKLARMYDLACASIEIFMQLDSRQGLAEYAPMFALKYLQLAAFTILKVGRCHIRDTLDAERGKNAYFSVIRIARRTTVEPGDLSARSSTILTQLWNSKNVFKRSDGTFDSLSLRCGSRLAMSTFHDCLWWWRTEFAGLPNPYEGKRGNGNIHAYGPQSRSRTPLQDVMPFSDHALLYEQVFPDSPWETAQDVMPIDWSTWGMGLDL